MLTRHTITTVERAVSARHRDLAAIGHDIHAHPELGFAEQRAAAAITAYLAALGFRLTMPYAGMATAFRAVLPGSRGRPRIAVFAEYDALAGLGHACGHNLITVAALAAATGVAARARRGGQFEVIGTPAEESKAGKAIMAERKAFRHLDAAFMTHPSTASKITVGCTANRCFRAEFRGRAAHAAGSPQQGVNALDAALLAFHNLHALRQHLREDARIHGIITHGGEAVNVIPERAVIEIGVRSLDEAYLVELSRRVETCCRSAARGMGATVRIRWQRYGYRAFRANLPLDALLLESYAAPGIPLRQGTGQEGRGSLDMANVSQEIPAAHPYFSIVPRGHEDVALHTRDFLALADTPAAYRQAIRAGTGMAFAAIRLLADTQAMRRVKNAFSSP